MATRRQVTCIIPDSLDTDQRIDAIGGSWGRTGIDQAITEIELGTYSYYTNVGREAKIIVAKRKNGRKYLKTEADGEEPNNLLSLPRCP